MWVIVGLETHELLVQTNDFILRKVQNSKDGGGGSGDELP